MLSELIGNCLGFDLTLLEFHQIIMNVICLIMEPFNYLMKDLCSDSIVGDRFIAYCYL